jgi:uncharacterized membrane protein YesL
MKNIGFSFGEHSFMRGLGRLCDLILLNVLFIISSIPLITAGAAATAMYTVTLKLVKHEESYIVKGFLVAFKDNFKKATIAWLILLGAGLLVYLNVILSAGMPIASTFLMPVFVFFAIVLAFIGMYVFPLLARYEDTLRGIFKNAFLLAMTKLPLTLLLLGVHVSPMVFIILNTEMFMVGLVFYAIIGFTAIAWFSSKILRRAFKVIDLAIEAREE